MSDGRHRDPDRNSNTPVERAAALAALAAVPGAPGTPCPPPEQIQAWHEGELEHADAEQVEAHVAACERCFALWTGLLELTESPATDVATKSAGPRRRRWFARPLPAFASIAVLAMLAFWLSPLTDPVTQALPDYDFRLSGSATMRGDEPPPADEAIRLTEGDRFELVLIPRTSVAGPLSSRAFVSTADGDIALLQSPPPEILDNGVVRILGEVGADVFLPEGRATLFISVGRPDALPDGTALSRQLETQSSVSEPDWVGWRVPLIVNDPEAR